MSAPTSTLLAADLGASSGRVMAATLGGGSLAMTEVHRFDNPVSEVDGLLRWDTAHLEAQIREGVRRAAARGPALSLGLDTWGVDFVLVGEDGTPVEPARCYRNEHTRAQVDPVLALLGEKALYDRTGIQTMHLNTLFQLSALKVQRPDLLARARRFAMIPDWLLHRLGAPLSNEVSNASTTQLLDARTRDWDAASLAALGLPPALFRRPVGPGTVLSPRVSLEGQTLALIAPATHDTGSAVAAVPLTDDRSAYIATGTWCLVGIEAAAPETGDASRRANFTNEAGVEGSYRYLRNCMGLWLIQQLKASWPGCPDFGPLTEAAAAAPPFQALVEADEASFYQPASMKAALEAWWQNTGQTAPRDPGGYARACLEGLALTFRRTLREIEALRGLKLERVHLVGGGCRNALLCQLTADATGLTVLAGPVEASALGNLTTQARALGLIGSLAEARQLIGRSFPLVEYRPSGDPEAWVRAEARLNGLTQRPTGGQ